MSKQNKFTKSVIQRLEQESLKKKDDKSVNQPIEKKADDQQKNIQANINKTINKANIKSKYSKTNLKLDDIISPMKEREAKNKTFYLDTEVIDVLQAQAKNLKMTDSKLANEIFRAVLNID